MQKGDTVFIVSHTTSAAGTTVHPFIDKDEAIEYCRTQAKQYSRWPETIAEPQISSDAAKGWGVRFRIQYDGEENHLEVSEAKLQ